MEERKQDLWGVFGNKKPLSFVQKKTGIVGLFGESDGYLLCPRNVVEQVNVFIGNKIVKGRWEM